MQRRLVTSAIQLASRGTTTAETTSAMALINLAGMIKAARAVHDSLFWGKATAQLGRKNLTTARRTRPRRNNVLTGTTEIALTNSSLRDYLQYRCDTFAAGCIAHSLPLLNTASPTIREVACVLGKIVSFFPGVMYGPLHYRHTEQAKIRALRNNRWNFDRHMSLSPGAKSELE